jgi:hypothetical protein
MHHSPEKGTEERNGEKEREKQEMVGYLFSILNRIGVPRVSLRRFLLRDLTFLGFGERPITLMRNFLTASRSETR